MNKRSVTLIEVLIAISLLSVIVIGLSSIEIFTRYHVVSSERRAKLQNEISFALEHMNKNISRAIGDADHNPISITTTGAYHSIWANIDYNKDGINNDSELIGYTYNSVNKDIRYATNDFPDPPGDSQEVIARKISSCVFSHTWNGVKENFITVKLSACWDPAKANCGTSPDNPSVTMSQAVYMPSVSTN